MSLTCDECGKPVTIYNVQQCIRRYGWELCVPCHRKAYKKVYGRELTDEQVATNLAQRKVRIDDSLARLGGAKLW